LAEIARTIAMTNPISARYLIDLSHLAPPDAFEGREGSRIVKVSKDVARRAGDFIAARQRLKSCFEAALAAEKRGVSRGPGDAGGKTLEATEQMTRAWNKLAACVAKRPAGDELGMLNLLSWEGLKPGNWELQHLLDKLDEPAHTPDPRIAADVRQQVLEENQQRIERIFTPHPTPALSRGQRIRRAARKALVLVKKGVRALGKLLPFRTKVRVEPLFSRPVQEPDTQEDIRSALQQNHRVSPGPSRMRARQASSESLKSEGLSQSFEALLHRLQTSPVKDSSWSAQATVLSIDASAPSHIRAQAHLLIARARYDEALAADRRRADEVMAGHDVAALDHIDVANAKTTLAAQALYRMLQVDATMSLDVRDPIRPLLDLVQAAHADRRVAQYGMYSGTAFEDTPDIIGSAERLAALGLIPATPPQDAT